MTRGITRATDRVAIWREAFDVDPATGKPVGGTSFKQVMEDHFKAKKPPTSEPPKGAAPEAPKASAVTITKSKKFLAPANGLKKLLDTLPSDNTGPNAIPPNSAAGVKNYLDAHPAFVKTYLKPEYKNMLRAQLGGENYEKLKYHMPKEHDQALHTQVQLPAPNSNKFKTPANGLKNLLSALSVSPELDAPSEVKSFIDSHPSLKPYLGPSYVDALKGHLGEENYAALQKHLAPPAPPAPPVTSVNPATAPITLTPQEAQATQQVGPHHNQYTDPSQLEKNQPKAPEQALAPEDHAEAEAIKAEMAPASPEPVSVIKEPPSAQPPPGAKLQHPALMQGIKKIFPDAPVDHMSDEELKGQLEGWLQHLPATEGYNDHLPQLQKLHDQFFGNNPEPGSSPTEPKAYDPLEVASDIYKINPHFMLEKLQKMKPEDAKAIAESQAANHGPDEPKWQAILDKHFGQGPQNAPTPEQPPAPPDKYQDLLDKINAVKPGWIKQKSWLEAQDKANNLQNAVKGWTQNADLTPEEQAGFQQLHDEHFGQDGGKPSGSDLVEDVKKVFPTADALTIQSLQGKSPEEQKKYLQDLVPEYEPGGQFQDEEQLGQLKGLLNKHFPDWGKDLEPADLGYGDEAYTQQTVGEQLKALKPEMSQTAENLDAKLKGKSPKQIKKLFDKTIEGYPDIADGLKKIYDENYGQGAQSTTTPGPFNKKEFLKDLKAAAPDAKYVGSEGADPQAQVKAYVDYLNSTAPGSATASLLQTVLDKHFGAQPAAPSTPPPGKLTSAIYKKYFGSGYQTWAMGGDVDAQKAAIAHQIEYLKGKGDSAFGVAKWQKVYDEAFGPSPETGDTDEIAQIRSQMGEQPAFDQWHTPTFLKWMASKYGLQPGQVNDIAKASGPGGKYESAGSLKSYFDEFQKQQPDAISFDPNAFLKEIKKADPDYWSPGGFGYDAIKGGTPEEAKAKLESLINDGVLDSPEEKQVYQDLLNKYFGSGQVKPPPVSIDYSEPITDPTQVQFGADGAFTKSFDKWVSDQGIATNGDDLYNNQSDNAYDQAVEIYNDLYKKHKPGQQPEPLQDWEQELLDGSQAQPQPTTVPTKADLVAIGISGAYLDIANQDPEKFQQNIDYVKAHPQSFPATDKGWGAIAQWLDDKAKGQQGGPAVGTPVFPGGTPGDPATMAADFAKILPVNHWDFSSPAKVAEFKTIVGDVLKPNYLDHHDDIITTPEQVQQVKAFWAKHFGGAAPVGGPAYDKNTVLKAYANIFGKPTNATTLAQSGVNLEDPATVKQWLQDKAESFGTGGIKGPKIQAIIDVYFGGGAPSGPAYDEDAIKKAYGEIFGIDPDGLTLGGNQGNPEGVKSFLQDKAKQWADDSQGPKIQALLDKHFGGGIPAGAFDPDAAATDWQQIFSGDQLGSTAYDEIHKSPEAAKAWAEQILASDGVAWKGKHPAIKAWVNKYFGGGTTPAPAPYVPPPWDPQQFAQEYIDVLGQPGGSSVAQGNATAEKALGKVNQLITDYPGTAQTEKLQALKQKWFGDQGVATAPGGDQADINAIKQEVEEEPPLPPAKPFKSQPLNPEDLTHWSGSKPTTDTEWKQFSQWWGNTQLSPEQEQGLYQNWFNKKASPEMASQWFQQVFEHHSEPSEGDLGLTEGAPAWAHNTWAFGDKAEAQWPVFQQWAAKDSGIPKGTSVKQKVVIWNGLTAAEKAAITDNYAPANPVDTAAVVAELAKAYPDSDFSKWTQMGQGTLKKSLQNLAEQGYKPAISLFNDNFGGTIPMPPDEPKVEKAPKEEQFGAASAPPSIPVGSVPSWVASTNQAFGYGSLEDKAKGFTPFAAWATALGKGDIVASGKEAPNSVYTYPKNLLNQWKVLPEPVKRAVAAAGGSLPFHDEEGFEQWAKTVPTLKDELQAILPDKGLDSYVWKDPGYFSNQLDYIKSYAKAETDPAKKQQLLNLWTKHAYYGKNTLAQTLKGIEPTPIGVKAPDWDAYLKNTDPDTVAKMVKKKLKTETNPDQWIKWVDVWGRYFGGPSGHKQVTNLLGKNSGTMAPNKGTLNSLYQWKKNGGDTSDSSPYFSYDESNLGPGLQQLLAQGGQSTGHPAYLGWTLPTGGKGGAFKLDPAMMGEPSTTSYAVPEAAPKGKQYQELMKGLENFAPGLFSPADQKTLQSEGFANWFEHAPADYREQTKNHPGLALDDYAGFMGGGALYSPTPEGPGGKTKYVDTTPFALTPMSSDKDVVGRPIPKSETHNPPRPGGEGIKFPHYQDAQETLPLGPGEQFAPQYAPMPIYRIIPNDVMNLDAGPGRAPDGLSAKQREFFLQQQRARLRRIDEIINGPKASRSRAQDLQAFKQWGTSHKVPEKDMQELQDEVFATQPTLSTDEKWKIFEEWGKKNNTAPEDLYDLASQLGVGNPGQAVPGAKGNYDHPELAQLVLDYIDAAGLGTHWTRDKDKLYEGIPSAGAGKSSMTATDRMFPVLISGRWGGQGETSSAEGGAYEVMNNSEREHNLRPGAPVHVFRVQIRSPDGDLHDLVDPGPISLWPPGRNETASGKAVEDKPSLAKRLDYDLGGKHKPEDWDTLVPGIQTDEVFRKLFHENGLLSNSGTLAPDRNLDSPKQELKAKLLKVYRQFFVGRPDLPTKPHIRRASISPPARTIVGTAPEHLFDLALKWGIPEPERYGAPTEGYLASKIDRLAASDPDIYHDPVGWARRDVEKNGLGHTPGDQMYGARRRGGIVSVRERHI